MPSPRSCLKLCILFICIFSTSLFLILYSFTFPYESHPRTLLYRTHTHSLNATHDIIPIEGLFYFPINKNMWISANGERILGVIGKDSVLYAPLVRLSEVMQQFVYRRPRQNFSCFIRQKRNGQKGHEDKEFLVHTNTENDSILTEKVERFDGIDEEERVYHEARQEGNDEHEASTKAKQATGQDEHAADVDPAALDNAFESYETVQCSMKTAHEDPFHASPHPVDSTPILQSSFETSPDGVIRFDWHSPSNQLQNGWNEFEIECGEAGFLTNKEAMRQKAEAYIWHGDENSDGYAVISDIDDTIKVTEVKRPLGLLQNVFFRQHRPTHKGLSKVYRKLSKYLATLNHNNEKETDVPFHYVSSSPYALHDTLIQFLTTFQFPLGTLHLKKVAFQDRTMHHLFRSSRRTKPPLLRRLLNTYTKRRFVLIGDSSEHDPEIYANIYREFGSKRVALIAIHCVKEPQCSEDRIAQDFVDVPEKKVLLFRNETDFQELLVQRKFLRG